MSAKKPGAEPFFIRMLDDEQAEFEDTSGAMDALMPFYGTDEQKREQVQTILERMERHMGPESVHLLHELAFYCGGDLEDLSCLSSMVTFMVERERNDLLEPKTIEETTPDQRYGANRKAACVLLQIVDMLGPVWSRLDFTSFKMVSQMYVMGGKEAAIYLAALFVRAPDVETRGYLFSVALNDSVEEAAKALRFLEEYVANPALASYYLSVFRHGGEELSESFAYCLRHRNWTRERVDKVYEGLLEILDTTIPLREELAPDEFLFSCFHGVVPRDEEDLN